MDVVDSVVTDGSLCTGEVVFRSGVVGIGNGAFLDNLQITGLDFSQNNTLSDIQRYAFFGSGLTSVVIPSSVLTIGTNAFTFSPLQTVTLSEGLRDIGDSAFGFTNIQHLTIPSSVQTIGGGAFIGNLLLTRVVFESPASVTNLAFSIFGVTALQTVEYCGSNSLVLSYPYWNEVVPSCSTSLTLPPDFLTPKTYGNPASVTGTAPALPATPVTPTAPAITAGATSVIYNGVPQSATYSVDQKSSCSTTYNGSAIPPVAAGTYAVSLTCSANSLTSTVTTTLTITKAAPVISWSTPAAITTATKLSSSQLNAFSYIPGSFTYSASAGSSLPAGDDLVTATFTPTDTTNYTSATMTVTIKVTA
jgi:hypothetical protein